MKKILLGGLLGSVLICTWIVLDLAYNKSESILIGFSGQLSGAYADLGIKGRGGVMLAVENINAAGGIFGRPLKLLVQDDKGTPEGARTADQTLIDAGVVAIIGHMTSGQTIAALPIVEKGGVILISPTTSTVELTGLDDAFFRVAGPCSAAAQIMARHIYQNKTLSKVVVIFDTDNTAYTRAYRNSFSKVFKGQGGQVIANWQFSSTRKPDFSRITGKILTLEPDGVLIIASPLDTALIAQKIRSVIASIPLFSSAWGQTDAMLQHGGKAVEGLESVLYFDDNSQNALFQKFRNQYYAQFGHEPSFAGGSAYEATLILAAALEKTKGHNAGLKNALKQIKDFEGLVGTISMDQYGDVIRTHFLHVVEHGKFVTKSTIGY